MNNTTIQDDNQWPAVLEALKGSLTKGQYDTHFLGSAARFDGSTLGITLPASANVQMVEKRLIEAVSRAVKSVTGEVYRLRFVAAEAQAAEAQAVEADEIEPPKPRTTVKGFTPVIDALADEIGFVPAGVYGVIWRYCQMSAHNCHASQETIANRMNVDRKTVNRHIKPLLNRGYVRCLNSHEKGKTKVYIITDKLEIEMGWTMEAKAND